VRAESLDVIASRETSPDRLAEAVRALGPAGEPHGFWSAIANDSSYPPAHRRTAVLQLFLRHVRPGATLAAVGGLLGGAAWLEDGDVLLVEDIGGALPVEPREGRTIARIAVLAKQGSACFVFLAVAGEVEAADVAFALRGADGSEAEIVEVGVHPEDGVCAD
jgi:hypothetical protein